MFEAEDMQGLILSGYGKQRSAAYVFFSIADRARAIAWLSDVMPGVTPGKKDRGRTSSLNLAFTHQGLASLGLGEATLATFSRPFTEGMSHPDRSRLLNDDVQSWQWGKPGDPIHVLLMLFATDTPELNARLTVEKARAQGALNYLFDIPSEDLPERPGHLDSEEHFGFVDGLAQPAIAEYAPENSMNDTKAGEFVFGYENEYGQFTSSPVLKERDADPASTLPGRDLGRNGTYLVLRQMEQDVPGFWNMVAAKAAGAASEDELAAKIVGRRRDGTPLVEGTMPNNFQFSGDPHGFGCPLGSHVRRANPRDMLSEDTAESIKVVKRHRLLRRGRPYGPPIEDRYTPDGQSRGLVFITLNANIERQFEFIQHAWITSPNFAGLHDEGDPLLGGRTDAPGAMTVPALPIRKRYTGILPHVTIKGGAYFFLPGMRALRYLASLRT